MKIATNYHLNSVNLDVIQDKNENLKVTLKNLSLKIYIFAINKLHNKE
jgi:hypothetical protein